MKFLVASKQIHSCNASVSSHDVFLKQKVSHKHIDFPLEVGKIIISKKYPFLNGEIIYQIDGDKKFTCLYLEEDKTFYRGNLHSSFAKTDEFKNLVQEYIEKGWDKESHFKEEEAYRKRRKILYQKELKKAKVVLWMGFEAYQGHPELFQGGFSDAVFHSPQLQQYVSKGCAYGWIGNSSVRTAAHDKQIEKGLRKRGISNDKMYNWISSSSGRHFADGLEGYTPQEQKEKIEKNLSYMYNNCVIYGSFIHKGTLSSSQDISKIYDEMGVLLAADLKYNKKQHINQLILAKEKVLNMIETIDNEEDKLFYSEISNVISEIFANLV